jgi:hypothetical protein
MVNQTEQKSINPWISVPCALTPNLTLDMVHPQPMDKCAMCPNLA